MTEAVVRTVNVSLLFFGFVETIIIACSFKKSMLQKRSANIFFLKVALAGFCMFCYWIFFIRWYEGRDPLNTVLMAIGYVGIYVIYYLYLEYLIVQINELSPRRKVPRMVSLASLAICVAGSFLRILTVANPEFRGIDQALEEQGVIANIGNTAGLIMIAITIIILIAYYDVLGTRHTVILSFMPIFMELATAVEPKLSGIELHYPLIMTEIIIVYTQQYLELSMRLEREELVQSQTRLNLTTGRMKPHYIYNVLTSIYYLCDSDPETAQRAVGTFAEYLRSTLETIEKETVVSFSWELKAVRNYLELETLRFGDRLHVEYDIETEDFYVPALSIQALVENAVNHGVASRAEGGTISIVTRNLSDGGVQIRIVDDGVGFDVTAMNSSDEGFEGIKSVKERLKLDLGADMTITSAPDKGTTVVITIRQGDTNSE